MRGTIFAVGEVGLLSTAAVTFSMFEGLKQADGTFLPSDADQADTLQNVYLISFWVGVSMVAVGIVEALVSYPGDSTQLSSPSTSNSSEGFALTPTGFRF